MACSARDFMHTATYPDVLSRSVKRNETESWIFVPNFGSLPLLLFSINYSIVIHVFFVVLLIFSFRPDYKSQGQASLVLEKFYIFFCVFCGRVTLNHDNIRVILAENKN